MMVTIGHVTAAETIATTLTTITTITAITITAATTTAATTAATTTTTTTWCAVLATTATAAILLLQLLLLLLLLILLPLQWQRLPLLLANIHRDLQGPLSCNNPTIKKPPHFKLICTYLALVCKMLI